jgi:hypothetical protein
MTFVSYGQVVTVSHHNHYTGAFAIQENGSGTTVMHMINIVSGILAFQQ